MKALRKSLENYLALRRGLGAKLHGEGVRLTKFVSFMEERKSPYITTRLALDWAQQTSARYPIKRLTMVRGFAKYVAGFDIRTEVPPLDCLSRKFARTRPYMYSDEEIHHLLRAAWRYRRDKPRGTYYCLLGLLTVSGLRIGEAIRLQIQDVDLRSGILTIRDTKFGKSRLVPIHPTTVRELRAYWKRRDEWLRLGNKSSGNFFMTRTGRPLTHQAIYVAFRWLSVDIGVRKVTSGPGPRIHDLRHRFAVTTLINWYRSGKNAEVLLPALATFLGHVSVESTYWYLTEYPELMKLAMQRLDDRWSRKQ
jgi:integrase/recombinase XerD